MVQPKSKLPWRIVEHGFQDKNEVSIYHNVKTDNHSKSYVYSPTAIGGSKREDLEYIVESANNFQKAIELLKECNSQMTENYRGLPAKINKFLNEIENG